LRARVADGVAALTIAGVARAASAHRLSLDRQSSSDDPHVVNVVAVVRDSFGNVVPRVPVRLAAKRGSVASSTAETDSAGRATIAWTLATASGDQLLIASAGSRGGSD